MDQDEKPTFKTEIYTAMKDESDSAQIREKETVATDMGHGTSKIDECYTTSVHNTQDGVTAKNYEDDISAKHTEDEALGQDLQHSVLMMIGYAKNDRYCLNGESVTVAAGSTETATKKSWRISPILVDFSGRFEAAGTPDFAYRKN
jgi:hypothetical protein